MCAFSRFVARSDEPYCHINTPTDRERQPAYRDMVGREPRLFFSGRLDTYQYLDMDMATGSATSMYDNRIWPYFATGAPVAKAPGEVAVRA